MDNINHPSHYQGKHECIEVMRAMFGDEAVKGFCRCNAYKYRFRAGRKDGQSADQDLKKQSGTKIISSSWRTAKNDKC